MSQLKKIKKYGAAVLNLKSIFSVSMMVGFIGCASRPVIAPCPPCVDQDSASSSADHMPNPSCTTISVPSRVYCTEPYAVAQNGHAGNNLVSEDYPNLTVGAPQCLGSDQKPRPSCRLQPDANGPFYRDDEICLGSKEDYDNYYTGENAAGHLMKRWSTFRTTSACQTSRNCRGNWLYFTQRFWNGSAVEFGIVPAAGESESASGTILPGDDPAILLASQDNFKKIMRPHHYWCVPGPIKPDCGSSNNTEASAQATSVSTCSQGIASIFGETHQGGIAASGAGTTMASLAASMNIPNANFLSASQNPAAANSPTTAMSSGARAAATPTAGGTPLSGEGQNGSTGNTDSGGGGGSQTLGASAPLANVGAPGAPSVSGGGGNGSSDGSASENGDSAAQNNNGRVEQTGAGATAEYTNAATNGGGSKSNGGGGLGGLLGGLFGGGSGSGAPQGGSATGVAFSKGGAAGSARVNPLLGSGGSLSDNDVERLLQQNSNRNIFDLAERHYTKWGSDVLSSQARESMSR